MKPIIILPPDTMSDENIAALRDNGICVVVAKNPAAVEFIDPIPSQSSRTQIEDAAIKLSRILLNKEGVRSRSDITSLYCDILTKGTPLDPNPPPTQEEIQSERHNQEHAIFDYAKEQELERLGIEEARAERAEIRAAAKAAKVQAAKTAKTSAPKPDTAPPPAAPLQDTQSKDPP